MALPKPSTKTDWTVGNPNFGTVTIEPTAQKKEDGWLIDEKPPREFMNFLFFNNDEWIKYLESVTDDLLVGNTGVNIVVGSGPGTVVDLNAADAAATPGDRIFVRSHPALSVTQNITKDDLEITFAPLALLTQATTLTLGLNVSGDRARIIRPRFTNWDNDVGDIPIRFTAASKNCVLDTAFFFQVSNVTNPIDDLGTDNFILNPIEE